MDFFKSEKQVEKIILHHFARNSFMYNRNDEGYYDDERKHQFYSKLQRAVIDELNAFVSVQEIQGKWKYLKDSFNRIDLKMKHSQTLTLNENLIYKKLFFLKPYVIHRSENAAKVVSKSKRDSKAQIAFEKLKFGGKQCFYEEKIKLKKHEALMSLREDSEQVSIRSAKKKNNKYLCCKILNNAIKALPNSQLEREGLLRVLKSIESFKQKCKK